MKLNRVSDGIASIKLTAKVTRKRIGEFLGKLRYIVLGVILGSTWTFVYGQIAPDIKSLISASETIVIENTFIQPVQAEEPEEISQAERIADIIHNLESSRGKNNYSKCEAQGKYNEYGFGIPGDGTYLCFEKGKDRVAVIGWIEQRLAQGYSEKELACVYNTGKRTESCPTYSDNFGQ